MSLRIRRRGLTTGLLAAGASTGALLGMGSLGRRAHAALRSWPKGSGAIVGAQVHVGDGTSMAEGGLAWRKGRIVAVGDNAAVEAAAGVTPIDANGQWLLPGFIQAASTMGLTEVDLERTTRDMWRYQDDRGNGRVRSGFAVAPAIHAESTLFRVAAVEGVTSAIARPRDGVLAGQSAWIDLRIDDHRGCVVNPYVAQSVFLGGYAEGSRADRIETLEVVLAEAAELQRFEERGARGTPPTLAFPRHDLRGLYPVLAGKARLSVATHRASDILAALRIAEAYGTKLIIVGGDQAWKVGKALADADATVVTWPTANLPESFDSLGATSENAARLHRAGVRVVVSQLDGGQDARSMAQEAGIAVAHGLPHAAAVRAVTLNVAEAYGIADARGSLAVGKVAHHALWPGDPFELSNWPSQVWIDGTAVPMVSRQTLLRDRYLRPRKEGR